MTNLKIFGVVVIVASAASSSALAQAAFSNPDTCAAEFPSANCENMGAGSPYDSGPSYYQGTAPRGYYRGTAYRRPGPGVVGAAAGAAGAAVGTAAAVAAAPFGGWRNSYAAYGTYGQPVMMYGPNGWYGDWSTYASRNGIVCRPGTYFKGEDGHQHPCQ
jgi:hypothetical protein